ncbi:SAP domain-containing protein [Paenibacillus sp. RC67]|uniref:SAP domain-containing protein n=1 Tax=Paenibacillus sp. RC67 TaxID=3039392 RepID=UPI0024ADD6DD|nr:SAP domain-containing protein [Paenibacillus sp. RC67]
MNRPHFSIELTIQEFENHYWYKTDLVDICRTYHISPSGTKAELEQRIKKLLSGEAVKDDRKVNTTIRKNHRGTEEISLHTKLIPDGFKFNARAREFFAQYFNLPKFSFTKDMAAALREAERQGDMEMTVADLIDIYNGKKVVEGPEEKTYQWNNFVKDFNKDPGSNLIKEDRMKVAAALWTTVRDTPGSKQYLPQLLDSYLKDKINKN